MEFSKYDAFSNSHKRVGERIFSQRPLPRAPKKIPPIMPHDHFRLKRCVFVLSASSFGVLLSIGDFL